MYQVRISWFLLHDFELKDLDFRDLSISQTHTRKLTDHTSYTNYNMHRFIITALACLLSSSLAFQPIAPKKIFSKPLLPKDVSNVIVISDKKARSTTLFSADASETEEWTKKRIHNTNWFRSSTVLLALGAMGASRSPLVPARPSALIHVLSFGTWFGTSFYTTFILGLTMFKNLPRQTFGKLQAKLFPKYFSLCSITIMLQIITLRSLPLKVTTLVSASLGGALLATLLNQFYLEPLSTKVMLERYDLENTEGGQDTDRYKELKASFGKLHGISSLSNLIALIGAIVYGSILSSLLL
jgi:hypothetical protein